MSRRDAALLLLLAALWGAVYPLTTIALQAFPAAWVVAGRAAVAAAVLLPVATRTGALAAIRTFPRRIVVAGLTQAALPLVLLTVGQQHVSAGIAGILSSAQPLVVVLIVTVLDRLVNIRELAGIAVGLLGVGILFAGDLTAGVTTALGGLAVVASACLFAAGAVYIHRALPDTPPLAVATGAMCLTTLLLAPIAALGPYPTHPGPVEVTSLVLIGIAGNAVALALFYFLIRSAGPTNAALAWYLAPAFAVLYDIPLQGPPSAATITGLALIVAGSALAAGRSKT